MTNLTLALTPLRNGNQFVPGIPDKVKTDITETDDKIHAKIFEADMIRPFADLSDEEFSAKKAEIEAHIDELIEDGSCLGSYDFYLNDSICLEGLVREGRCFNIA